MAIFRLHSLIAATCSETKESEAFCMYCIYIIIIIEMQEIATEKIINKYHYIFAASTLPQCKAADIECLPRVMTSVIQLSAGGENFLFCTDSSNNLSLVILFFCSLSCVRYDAKDYERNTFASVFSC